MMRPLEANDPRTIGSYTILGLLGTGGMGRVYLGQSWTGKRVAIKVVRSEIAEDPVFRERFAREVEAVRQISALYTAPVVDADTQANPPWLATTYIDGPSLEQEIATSGPMSVSSVLILAAGLAEAFIAIHRAHLVHRDLKPSNVLLTKDGPCVIDFGIARMSDSTSLTQGVIGTPAYMSPEHVAGAEVSPASDIFSIGATLAFAATGKGPLGQGTPHSLIAKLISGQLDITGVPEQLKPIIARCLARDARFRPSATELLSMLAAAGATHPYPGWFSPSAPGSAMPAAPTPPGPPTPPPASPFPQPSSVPPVASVPPIVPSVPPAQPPVYAAPPAQRGYAQVPQPQPYPASPAYPPTYAPAGYPPYQPPAAVRRSRTGLWITLAALAVLLVTGGTTLAIVLAQNSPGGVASPTTPAVTTTTQVDPTTQPPPSGRIVVRAPQTLAGLTRSTDTSLQSGADALENEVRDKVGGVTSAEAAFYNDPSAAGRLVLFVGITASIVSPETEIDDTFESFNQGDVKVGDPKEIPAGPLGGMAKCADGKIKDVKIALCVWADNESLGAVIFYNRQTADSKDLFIRIRGESTTRL